MLYDFESFFDSYYSWDNLSDSVFPIVVGIIVHIFLAYRCIKRGDNNTINAFFWLIVIISVPVLGPILYLLFSAFLNDLSSHKIGVVRLFDKNETGAWYNFQKKENVSVLDLSKSNYSTDVGINRSKVKINHLLLLCCFCIALAVLGGDLRLSFLPFASLIVLHDWLTNYCNAPMYFKIINKSNAYEMIEPSESLLGKPCFIEHDYLKDGMEDKEKGLNPRAMVSMVWKIMPKICSKKARIEASQLQLQRNFGYKVDTGNDSDNYYIQVIDPFFDLKQLDVKSVTQLPIDSHISCISYYDWQKSGKDDNDLDIYYRGSVERRIYKVRPRFRYLLSRAVVYILFYIVLFTPLCTHLNYAVSDFIESTF